MILWMGLATICLSSVASAQRFRVVVGVAGTTKASVVEFRPCVPAETSDCGVWLDRVVDVAADSSYGVVAVHRSVTSGSATISIVDQSVAITPSKGARAVMVKGLHGRPTALVAGGDGASVFVVSDSSVAGELPEVCLIDLRFNEVIARLKLDAPAAGIAMARR
jgi:hypothetical protein